MQDSWQLLTDDAGERQHFMNLQNTLALPATAAGPKNRLRQVVRIETDGGSYFLKTFTKTQWKNRLWFACSAPRAHDDAERELRVTQALHAAGFLAPRPIALGRRGAASFYLCAEVEGRSCRDLLEAGSLPDKLSRQVASHCGRLLANGFRLPDLSADHVFAAADGRSWRLSVLDLHNGWLGRGGPVPGRVAVRVLRRFVRSVRDLPVPWLAALRFGVRLLRHAGRKTAARAVLAALPPFSTAQRYERGGKSLAYANRSPKRHARELLLLQRVWPGRPGECVLDLPCGAGRLRPLLENTYGHRVVQADGALAMLAEARAHTVGTPAMVQANALAMPFADHAVDGVVMFRFLHHLAPELSQRAIAEACRTAQRFVVVSFFHPCSFHHVQRRVRQLAGGPTTRFVLRLADLRRRFGEHGFALVRHTADLPFARDLWIAAFVRTRHTGPGRR